MPRFLTAIIISLLALLPAYSAPVEVNGIAAKVNGRIITKNEVNFMLAPIYAQLATEFPRRGAQFDSEFKGARERVMQELVDRQIILSEFEQLGAAINDRVIEEEVDRQIRELYNGDEAKFRQELKKSRLTMGRYREITREKLVVEYMRAQQFSDAPPPLPDEIRKEYNKIKIDMRDQSKDKISFRKIFIPSADPANPLATPESQLQIAEGIVKDIKSGKDFGEQAKTYSKDAFAEQGGLQENVDRTDFAAEFAAIIFDAPENKIIGPLLDPRGFTIVKVTNKNYGPSPPLSKVRPMVEKRVQREKTSVQYERWIEGKRKRAMIKINE